MSRARHNKLGTEKRSSCMKDGGAACGGSSNSSAASVGSKKHRSAYVANDELMRVRRDRKDGGALTYSQRESLPDSAFVYPGERKYPIHDKSHARNALARVSQFGSDAEKRRVRAAVKSKYPDIGE